MGLEMFSTTLYGTLKVAFYEDHCDPTSAKHPGNQKWNNKDGDSDKAIQIPTRPQNGKWF